MSASVLVLGAGPGGLTAAHVLSKRGVPVLVLEAGEVVGGLARTEVRDGYRFDLGGHRFFTKSAEVRAIWDEVMGEEMLLRPRLSRIHWRGRFLDYPLRGADVVRKLGPVELARCLASYLGALARGRGGEETFEQWVSARFGRRLFELFFRSYTEKVWGVPTSEIRAEWAAQRIRGLSFGTAARAALLGNGGDRVRSLVEQFHYPKLGPGQMWERMAARIEAAGGEVRTGAAVERLELRGGRVVAVHAGGERIEADEVISSLPLRDVVRMTVPHSEPGVLEAALGLRYRDFLTVALVLREADPFPDNWIYVHDPEVRVGRIQNYRAWSEAMVPHEDRSCVGLEYFCFEGDDLWAMPDAQLVDLASGELADLGFASPSAVEAGHVVRVPRAYPMYDADYADRVARIRSWLDGIANLRQIGRNGLHRYNNSDHSMLTGIRAAQAVLGEGEHDIWAVNADAEYHEEVHLDRQPYRRAPVTPAMALEAEEAA